MTDRPRASLRRQLNQASEERHRRIHEFRVERILDLLKDERLATEAALKLDSREGILLECSFAPDVWSDPRIAARVRQLRDRGVVVEPVEHEFEVAGHRFSRSQIRVRY
jgi:hypothetical protein